jgi:aryl-alcohol dehydrogenase-like predicted oxidoreductase
MVRDLCLGLLGFSGNYGIQDYGKLKEALSFALRHYSLIDISTDYGIDYNLVEVLKKIDIDNAKSHFIYKVGCNYTGAYDVNLLISQTRKDLQFFGVKNIDSIMFHRPSPSKLHSDIKFFRLIRSRFPEIPLGICTNSKPLYCLYKKKMDIELVQIALNPFDYADNISFLDVLDRDKVSVQARSILSSGLLSGKYDRKSIFIDNMRSRYHEKDARYKYHKRIDTASRVIKYIEDEYNMSLGDIPVFLYSVFEKIPNVKNVIRGGSSLEQISNNLTRVPIDSGGVNHFISMMESDWGCEYV